ncbi:MAG: hypothetical protein K5767_07150 [Clostridia bacterium]|nr:hypothetical protein [Clostridia bacterium]
MNNKPKKRRSGGRRALCLGMAAIMTVAGAPASFAEQYTSGVTSTCDEAYYGTIDYYGNLTNGSVVKTYMVNGQSSITDYGNYTDVKNLTDNTEPDCSDGVTTFTFDKDKIPDRFYFEGTTTEPFDNLPWNFSIKYKLNGVAAEAEDLAGQKGMVEIDLDIIPNENASEYAKNNYTMEAAAVFNQSEILSLEQEGGQMQLMGNLRTVLFMALPGEEQHFKLMVGTDSFEFSGFTFIFAPATLSQLDKIADLQEKKDDLEDDYKTLVNSFDATLDAMANMTDSLNRSANGLDELNAARETISSGKGTVYDDIDVTNEDLLGLATAIDPLYEDIANASTALTGTKAATKQLIDDLDGSKEELQEISDLLKKISKDTGSVKDLVKHTKELKGYLNDLANAVGDMDYVDVRSNKNALDFNSVESMITAYNTAKQMDSKGWAAATGITVGKEEDALKYIIKQSDKNNELDDTEIATLAALIKSGHVDGNDSSKATAITALGEDGQAKYTKIVTAYETMKNLAQIYYAADAGGNATFKDFAKSYLKNVAGQDDKTAERNASTLAWLYSQADNGENIEGMKAIIDQISNNIDGTLDDTVDSVNDIISDLKSPTKKLLKKLGDVCGELDAVNALLDDTQDVSEVADDLVTRMNKLIDDIDDVYKSIDDFEPQAQTAMKNLQSLSTKAASSLRNLSKLLGDTEYLARKSGDQLDQGTKDTLSAVSDTLRKTADAMATSKNLKKAKDDLDRIIRDVWEEHTGKFDNILNMDNTLDAQSLTSDRNPSPTTVQVIIRSQEIEVDKAAANEEAAQEIENSTFWSRVGRMFTDIGAAIKNAFS